MHKHGGDIYSAGKDHPVLDFSANINFKGMPDTVYQAALLGVEKSLHYPDVEYRDVRQALAKREKVKPAHLICGNGAAELMFALSQALKPKKALTLAPSFFEYEQALLSAGCQVIHYTLSEKENFAADEKLTETIKNCPDLDFLVLGNPNNPTGRILPKALLEEIAGICQKKGIFLMLDESFYDFLTPAAKEQTLCGSSLKNQALFVLKSFTKMYAMPGLRFGYGICPDEKLLQKMHEILQPWNVSLPAATAAQAAAEEIKFAADTAGEIAYLREELGSQLTGLGIKVFPSEANFLLLKTSKDLKKKAQKAGILIRDCSNFPGLDQGFYRVCVRGREENQRLIAALGSGEV